MRKVILIPVAVLLAAAGLAFAIVVAVPLAQDVAGPQSFVHIQTVSDAGGDGQPVNLTLPFGAVGALLAMAPGAIAENGNIRLGDGQHLPVDTLRDLWAQVQSTSGPVTVEHEGAVIRVEQTGERVAVRFERNGEATQAELPAPVLDAALGPPTAASTSRAPCRRWRPAPAAKSASAATAARCASGSTPKQGSRIRDGDVACACSRDRPRARALDARRARPGASGPGSG